MRTLRFSAFAIGLALTGWLMGSQSVRGQDFNGPVADRIDARQNYRVQERQNARRNDPYAPNRPIARGLAQGHAAVARGAESATAHAAAGAANAANPWRPGSPYNGSAYYGPAYRGPYTANYGGGYNAPPLGANGRPLTFNDYNVGNFYPPPYYNTNPGYRPPVGYGENGVLTYPQ